jgi:putative membrane protein
MKTFVFAIVVGALAGCAQMQQRTAMGNMGVVQSETDSSFAHAICQNSAVEMELGKLAEENTRNKDVRKFASRISDEQRKSEKELSALFQRNGITTGAQLDANLQTSLDRLAELKGGEFDQEFKNQVVAEHEAQIAALERQAEDNFDRDLQAFAQRQLPRLRSEVEMARNLSVSNDKNGPAGDNFKSAEGTPVVRGIGNIGFR